MGLGGVLSPGRSLDLILRTRQPGLASHFGFHSRQCADGAPSPLRVGLIPVTPIPDQDRSAGAADEDELWALGLVGLSPCWV